MNRSRLPIWLDPKRPPHDDPTGQAVWAFGMWSFIPFSNGLPLQPLCATLDEARQAVRLFETTLNDRRREAHAFRVAKLGDIADQIDKAIERWESECRMVSYNSSDDDEIPSGHLVVRLADSADSYVAVDAKGVADPTAVDSLQAAILAIRGPGVMRGSDGVPWRQPADYIVPRPGLPERRGPAGNDVRRSPRIAT